MIAMRERHMDEVSACLTEEEVQELRRLLNCLYEYNLHAVTPASTNGVETAESTPASTNGVETAESTPAAGPKRHGPHHTTA